jgi:hypothetical protein
MFKQFSLLLMFMTLNLSVSANELVNQHLETSRRVAVEFTQTLGKVLKGELEASGAEGAVNVCQQVAPAMAKEASSNQRIVTRVSLKNRNPSMGVPDVWEAKTLAEFDRLQQTRPRDNLSAPTATTTRHNRFDLQLLIAL